MRLAGVALVAVGLIVLAGDSARAATAEDLEATVKRLQAKVAAQDRRIAELESKQDEQRLRKVRREAVLEVLKELNLAVEQHPNDFRLFWKNGVRLETRDGRIKVKFGGRLMADWGWIDGSGIEKDLGTDLEDGAEIRRARLYVGGTIGKDLEFKLQFEFAGGDADIGDTYLRLKSIPVVGSVTVGHFEEPFSLEELTSNKYVTFLERALPNVFSPKRNMGIMAHNTFCDQRGTWAVGLFRPNSDDYGEDDTDGVSALTGRVTVLPVYRDKGRVLVHLGAGYSFRTLEDALRYRQRPEAHFIGQRFSDTGAFRARRVQLFGGEAALVYGPFSLQGEVIGAAVDSDDADDPCLAGFYVQGSYFLTGEHRPYKRSAGTFSRVKPRKNFRENGGWGAWEIAGRYSYLDLDAGPLPDTARALHNATVGLNWYLTPNVRIMWNYIRACVDGIDTSDAADIFLTRVQFDF